MAFFLRNINSNIISSDVQTLLLSMYQAENDVYVRSVSHNLNRIFDKAFQTDPRMLFALSSFREVENESSRFGMFLTHHLQLIYHSDYSGGPDLDDVYVDDHDLSEDDVFQRLISSLSNDHLPKSVRISTLDPQNWMIRNGTEEKLRRILPGFKSCNSNSYTMNNMTDWHAVSWSFQYLIPQDRVILNYEKEGRNRADAFIRTYLQDYLDTHGKLAPFMVVYLTHNFLAINFHLEECERDEDNLLNYEYYSAVGAFNGTANWKGMQQAFLYILEKLDVTAKPVFGLNMSTGKEYGWLLVQLDNEWYHIDPCWANRNGSLKFSRFLVNDDEMQKYYSWNTMDYPSANGYSFDYAEVRSHIIRNQSQYDTIDRRLLRP